MDAETAVYVERSGPMPEEELNTRELLEQEVCSDAMLDSLLGPAAICTWHGDDLDITRFNRQLCDEVKSTRFRELLHSVQTHVLEGDVPLFYDLLKGAVEDPAHGASGVIRFMRPDDAVSQFRLHFYFLGEDATGRHFYTSARDLTHFITLDDHMRLLSHVAPASVVFLWRRGVEWSFRVALHGLEKEMGLSAEQLEHELNDGRFRLRIVAEVQQKLKRLILRSDMEMDRFSEPFDAIAEDGRVLQLQIRFDRVHDERTGVEYVLVIRKFGRGI